MTIIKVEQLVWDDFNSEHIKRHGVSKEEIEETLTHLLGHKRGKKGKLILIGRAKKRLISVIIGQEKGNTYYIVTARDAARKEREHVYEKEK